jgi:cytoskeleton protein RodZ
MKAIGERLRGERERQGLSVDKIAIQLRLNPSYLEAIERGDIDSLPGRFFYRSFVRQYVKLLRLDEAEFEREMESLKPPPYTGAGADGEPEEFPLVVPSLDSSRRNGAGSRLFPTSLIALVLVVVACSAVYSLWYKNRSTPDGAALKSQPPATRPAPAPVQQPVKPAAQPPQAGEPAAAPPTAPPLHPAAEQVARPPAEPPKPEVRVLPPEVPGVRFQVSMTASEDAWIRFSSAGRILYIGTLRAGQSRTVEGADAAQLVVGNAGGLDVRLNGRSIGPLGPRGQPRTLVLTPEGVAPRRPAEQPAPPAQNPTA